MNICGISCSFEEYRCTDGVWHKTDEGSSVIDDSVIANMIECNRYFTSLGGHMRTYFVSNRRFGEVCNKIVSISICRTVCRIYSFSYNNARRKVEGNL